MKKILFLFLFVPLIASAQPKILMSVGVSPNLYINHKVAPKENYYSIGRIYNISPKDITPFNNLKLENGLSLGQQIKIPLNSTNFFQSGNAAADETFVPVYYEVKEKEGLFRVAVNHNDLSLETLKHWNNLKVDVVKKGTKLIVGYLKVKKELSALAKNGVGNFIYTTLIVNIKLEENNITELNKKTIVAAEIGTKKSDSSKKVIENTKLIELVPKKTDTKEFIKSEPEKMAGVFKNNYESQTVNNSLVEASGTAGIFKSTSGWADKKYYCLFNNTSPGTIIKITNTGNGKFIFAKVLDLMPDIKQNEGLLLIISNAAAEELDVNSSNFSCSINYSK